MLKTLFKIIKSTANLIGVILLVGVKIFLGIITLICAAVTITEFTNRR